MFGAGGQSRSPEEGGQVDVPCWLNQWLDTAPAGVDVAIRSLATLSSSGDSATQRIWRGGFPEVQTLGQAVVSGWMQGYVSTYFHHYRQHSGAEVDLVLESDGFFFPIEVKAASLVSSSGTRSIQTFQERFG